MLGGGHLEAFVRVYTHRCSLAVLLPLACFLAQACASPAPQAPQPTSPQPRRVFVGDRQDLVEYRALRREDFLLSSPPVRADTTSGHVAAVTCAGLVPNPGLKFRAVREPTASEFEVSVDNLSFSARMDPTCSWWDDRSQFVDPKYVLQHEQIHFAIVELEARELNRRAGEIAEKLRTRAATGEAALAAAKQAFNAEYEAALQRTAARSKAFDLETSLGLSPEKQTTWQERIDQELAASSAFAAPAPAAAP